MTSMARDLGLVHRAVHSMFVYVACTEDGYVKVGISGHPVMRICQVHGGSPSPVQAAAWAWMGSRSGALEFERRIKKEWKARRTRGEWYRFDYSQHSEKVEFHATLDAVFEVITDRRPEWTRVGPERVRELLAEGKELLAASSGSKPSAKHPWKKFNPTP